MKKYILSILILTSAGNLAAANIGALTALDSGESGSYDSGYTEYFQSSNGKEKLKLGSKSAAVDKPKIEQINAQVTKGVGKTKEIFAKAKAKVSSGYNKSKDFLIRNYDKAKVKTQSAWERIKSWFTGTKNSDVKA
jgi:hypothetical protein